MTAPIPEEEDQPPIEADDPPGEHAGELPGEPAAATADDADRRAQAENAETSLDEPSDGSGGE